MKYSIEDKILAESNLTLNEYLFLLFNTIKGDIPTCIDSLIKKGWAERDLFDSTKIVLSDNTKEKVLSILVDSDKIVENKQDFYINLANKLRELFPKGNKPGTTYNWRSSTAEISRKLKNLAVKYNCKFTEEEAIEATKAYIASFNGDYRYMKLLKYFLLKTPINNNGDVEVESEFMTYLENKDNIEHHDNSWTIDLA